MKKLYALVGEECAADNPDSPQHQEILMPGFLLASIIKERLDEFLNGLRMQLLQDQRRGVSGIDFRDNKYLVKTFSRVSASVGPKVTTFLASGNLVSPSGLDLQQTAGFTIVAEKLNFYRFLAHFRSVHRGSFFMELRTTTVRKLLPESWGFLCPVHTPDGGPCGLLNHFSHKCELITDRLDASAVAPFLSSMGMDQPFNLLIDGKNSISVQLDGRIIGWTSQALAVRMARALRLAKTEGKHNIPLNLEIGLVPSSHGGQYPGLYLFSTRARMMRPVKYLKNMKLDHIGSFEQVYLDIACRPEEVTQTGVYSHVEIAPTHMLSVLANLTPFSDYNQSPRNMYQCQMGKQTMGTPTTALPRRTDGKMYRIQSPQTPIVRPALHDTYGFDAFPNGTNAVVAVISYTGYDMEDAMIINKSADERGFGYGTVYKSAVYDLKEMRNVPDNACFMLGPDVRRDDPKRAIIDSDGLPAVGCQVKTNDVIVAWYNHITSRTVYEKYKGDETAYVDEVRLIGAFAGSPNLG
jgi:DNA-directed RNA polymerase I subunit RPA2